MLNPTRVIIIHGAKAPRFHPVSAGGAKAAGILLAGLWPAWRLTMAEWGSKSRDGKI